MALQLPSPSDPLLPSQSFRERFVQVTCFSHRLWLEAHGGNSQTVLPWSESRSVTQWSIIRLYMGRRDSIGNL